MKRLAVVLVLLAGLLRASAALSLVWTCHQTNLVYEVWRAGACLTNWSQVATVVTNCYFIPQTNSAAFFRVRARDPLTGMVSDWATTSP